MNWMRQNESESDQDVIGMVMKTWSILISFLLRRRSRGSTARPASGWESGGPSKQVGRAESQGIIYYPGGVCSFAFGEVCLVGMLMCEWIYLYIYWVVFSFHLQDLPPWPRVFLCRVTLNANKAKIKTVVVLCCKEKKTEKKHTTRIVFPWLLGIFRIFSPPQE